LAAPTPPGGGIIYGYNTGIRFLYTHSLNVKILAFIERCFMKNTNIYKLFSIIAFIAIIGFSMMGCGEDDKQDADEETDGRLTINGLSDYIGKDIHDSSINTGFIINEELGKVDTYFSITGDSVTLKVWKYDNGTLRNYKGNDHVVFSISIDIHESRFSILTGTVDVTFSNGIGSGTFSPNP
jgi:hypothetical protein